ncbi:MAG TPA: hypothetical protein VL242_48355 [Sorangium sp.]|nr:hypothetical protein [Sorangium sp.]
MSSSRRCAKRVPLRSSAAVISRTANHVMLRMTRPVMTPPTWMVSMSLALSGTSTSGSSAYQSSIP